MRHPHGTVRGVDVLASRAAGLIVVYAQLIRAGSTPSREREEGKTDRYSLTSNVRHRHHVSSASETRAPDRIREVWYTIYMACYLHGTWAKDVWRLPLLSKGLLRTRRCTPDSCRSHP